MGFDVEVVYNTEDICGRAVNIQNEQESAVSLEMFLTLCMIVLW